MILGIVKARTTKVRAVTFILIKIISIISGLRNSGTLTQFWVLWEKLTRSEMTETAHKKWWRLFSPDVSDRLAGGTEAKSGQALISPWAQEEHALTNAYKLNKQGFLIGFFQVILIF